MATILVRRMLFPCHTISRILSGTLSYSHFSFHDHKVNIISCFIHVGGIRFIDQKVDGLAAPSSLRTQPGSIPSPNPPLSFPFPKVQCEASSDAASRLYAALLQIDVEVRCLLLVASRLVVAVALGVLVLVSGRLGTGRECVVAASALLGLWCKSLVSKCSRKTCVR